MTLFDVLPNYLKSVCDDYYFVDYSRGDKIINASKPIENLFYFIRGKAKICLYHENGNASIIQFVEKEDYVGTFTLLGIEKNPKDVVALKDCTCLRLPLNTNPKLKTNSNFLFHLAGYLGQKSHDRAWFNAKNQNYELKNRLAAFILDLSNNGIYNERHTETAEYLGTSYRHLLYTFKELIDEGCIRKSPSIKRAYEIVPDKLSILASDVQFGGNNNEL